jgi:hypothetical protein
MCSELDRFPEEHDFAATGPIRLGDEIRGGSGEGTPERLHGVMLLLDRNGQATGGDAKALERFRKIARAGNDAPEGHLAFTKPWIETLKGVGGRRPQHRAPAAQ